ncbi:hypothetical protein BDR03DRAFT_951149 [Suillus americanus]|nr:hypothetical protein BDR03DRAFT_951149 [Suillus americanus]
MRSSISLASSFLPLVSNRPGEAYVSVSREVGACQGLKSCPVREPTCIVQTTKLGIFNAGQNDRRCTPHFRDITSTYVSDSNAGTSRIMSEHRRINTT